MSKGTISWCKKLIAIDDHMGLVIYKFSCKQMMHVQSDFNPHAAGPVGDPFGLAAKLSLPWHIELFSRCVFTNMSTKPLYQIAML